MPLSRTEKIRLALIDLMLVPAIGNQISIYLLWRATEGCMQ